MQWWLNINKTRKNFRGSSRRSEMTPSSIPALKITDSVAFQFNFSQTNAASEKKEVKRYNTFSPTWKQSQNDTKVIIYIQGRASIDI